METCSKHCHELDINSSPPRSCLDASLGASSSSDEEHSDFRYNESPEETSGDFATLFTLSGLPRNDDSGVETSLGQSPQEEDQIVDAICRRTRAHFSLTDMSLDELETFLQESDEEDYFQNVDDEEEYRKFVATVQGNWKDGSAVDIIDGSKQVEEYDEDEDEEDDYDFEIELEEVLESDYEEVPKQETLKRNRRRREAVLGHTFKKRTLVERPLGSARTPLRPILPSIAGRDVSSDARKFFSEALHSGKEAIGFTPCQRRQLQCLMHEHVQLLVQVFSVTVVDPARQQIAADTHKLLLQLADTREQVLSWKRSSHPEICCCPHHVFLATSSNLQPLVKLNAFQPRSSNRFITKHESSKEASCPARGVLDTKTDSDTSPHSNLQKGERNCTETSTSIPTTRKITSLLDVAALALVKDFVADVSKGVQEHRHQRSQISDSTDKAQKPLFPVSMIQVPPAQNCQRRKTMAGSLVEDTKLNGIILVPAVISTAISRFTALFDPMLFPYKPPPAALAKRLLFTEAEDELLAMGLMRYNTNWEKIQQLLLPSKTTHQAQASPPGPTIEAGWQQALRRHTFRQRQQQTSVPPARAPPTRASPVVPEVSATHQPQTGGGSRARSHHSTTSQPAAAHRPGKAPAFVMDVDFPPLAPHPPPQRRHASDHLTTPPTQVDPLPSQVDQPTAPLLLSPPPPPIALRGFMDHAPPLWGLPRAESSLDSPGPVLVRVCVIRRTKRECLWQVADRARCFLSTFHLRDHRTGRSSYVRSLYMTIP
ncbi:hypothetical protein L7F22_042881 [Adiantum nelumboides]|nr:hypothetical protein [Adiantum nelumboides]